MSNMASVKKLVHCEEYLWCSYMLFNCGCTWFLLIIVYLRWLILRQDGPSSDHILQKLGHIWEHDLNAHFWWCLPPWTRIVCAELRTIWIFPGRRLVCCIKTLIVQIYIFSGDFLRSRLMLCKCKYIFRMSKVLFCYMASSWVWGQNSQGQNSLGQNSPSNFTPLVFQYKWMC